MTHKNIFFNLEKKLSSFKNNIKLLYYYYYYYYYIILNYLFLEFLPEQYLNRKNIFQNQNNNIKRNNLFDLKKARNVIS